MAKKKRSKRKGKLQPKVSAPLDLAEPGSERSTNLSESTMAPSTESAGTLSPYQSEDEWGELIGPPQILHDSAAAGPNLNLTEKIGPDNLFSGLKDPCCPGQNIVSGQTKDSATSSNQAISPKGPAKKVCGSSVQDVRFNPSKIFGLKAKETSQGQLNKALKNQPENISSMTGESSRYSSDEGPSGEGSTVTLEETLFDEVEAIHVPVLIAKKEVLILEAEKDTVVRQPTKTDKKIIVDDFLRYDLTKLADAEKAYYEKLAKSVSAPEAVCKPATKEPAKAASNLIKPATKKPAAKVQEKVWSNKSECEDAEKKFQERLAQLQKKAEQVGGPESLSAQIQRARQHIKNSLDCVDNLVDQSGEVDMALASKLSALELENKALKKVTDDLKNLILKLENRVSSLEGGKPAAAAAPAKAEEEDDDDVDLFGSDDEEEDEEKARITAERLKAYAEKKAKKPQVIAKTSVLLDVKPWDDETDMNAACKLVKAIEMDGLLWGASKLVPIGYGIKKLQVMCTVEDAKVSVDELSEKIEAFEDYVQSVDVAAMNKI